MKTLAVLLATFFVFSVLSAPVHAASVDRFRASTSDSSCRPRKKAKKQTSESKDKKKKGKDEKKPYGFEL